MLGAGALGTSLNDKFTGIAEKLDESPTGD
jgi:hypothetical protein